MVSIPLVDQAQIGRLSVAGHPFRRLQVDDGRPHQVQQGALINGRQISVGPVLGAVDKTVIGQDHEGRQILVLGAQAIDHPGTQGGAARHGAAQVHEQAAGGVVVAVGVERPNHRHFVDPLAQVREKLGDLDAALSPFAEPEGTADIEEFGAFGLVRSAAGNRSVVPGEIRFGVEGVHVAGTPAHEQEDAGLGLGRQVGGLGGQRAGGRFRGQQSLSLQQVGQGQPPQTGSTLQEEVPAPHGFRLRTVRGARDGVPFGQTINHGEGSPCRG